jgi:hypothetical protein
MKRQARDLQKLREKRIFMEGQANLNKLKEKEQARIDAAQRVNQRSSPLAKFQQRVKKAQGRLDNVSKTVTGTAADNKYKLGQPNISAHSPGWGNISSKKKKYSW